MTLRTLVIALAITVAGGLALPAQVEAQPRHQRHGVAVADRGHHRSAGWRGSYGHYRPYRAHRYDRYYAPYYAPYAPYYAPYYDAYPYRSYRRGPLHFHGGVSCYLPHLSIHLGW